MVLLTPAADALWVTSWPYAEYVKHEWAGAWMCSFFRNESFLLSSVLIHEAVMLTREHYGPAPERGFVTFVDTSKTRPKRNPGYCYLMAGWEPIGHTKAGLVALGLSQGAIEADYSAWQPPTRDAQMEMFA